MTAPAGCSFSLFDFLSCGFNALKLLRPSLATYRTKILSIKDQVGGNNYHYDDETWPALQELHVRKEILSCEQGLCQKIPMSGVVTSVKRTISDHLIKTMDSTFNGDKVGEGDRLIEGRPTPQSGLFTFSPGVFNEEKPSMDSMVESDNSSFELNATSTLKSILNDVFTGDKTKEIYPTSSSGSTFVNAITDSNREVSSFANKTFFTVLDSNFVEHDTKSSQVVTNSFVTPSMKTVLFSDSEGVHSIYFKVILTVVIGIVIVLLVVVIYVKRQQIRNVCSRVRGYDVLPLPIMRESDADENQCEERETDLRETIPKQIITPKRKFKGTSKKTSFVFGTPQNDSLSSASIESLSPPQTVPGSPVLSPSPSSKDESATHSLESDTENGVTQDSFAQDCETVNPQMGEIQGNVSLIQVHSPNTQFGETMRFPSQNDEINPEIGETQNGVINRHVMFSNPVFSELQNPTSLGTSHLLESVDVNIMNSLPELNDNYLNVSDQNNILEVLGGGGY